MLLDHALADHLVDRGFHERGGDGLAGAVALPEVGYGGGVRDEVSAELTYRLANLSCRSLSCWPSASLSSRPVVMSSMVCRARKMLPCQRNHFSRCSSAARVADSWGGRCRPLASWVSTVIRMVRWNQSSRCSACGLRWRGSSRMSSPPSVRKVTCWFGLHPLGGQHLEQAAFGFAVVGLHVPETR